MPANRHGDAAGMKGITTILVVGLLAVVLSGCGPSTEITKESFERIEDDMTKAEVIAILGDPSGSEVVAERNGKKLTGSVWEAPGIKIVIAFASDGKVSTKSIEME
jgi:hypothetical protein